jgi:flagellar hook assembly protein FlgD
VHSSAGPPSDRHALTGASLLRRLAFTLTATILAGLGAVAPVASPVAFAALNPKVAIIVGATHGATAGYRDDANQVAAAAAKYTTNVVKVYSPNATWSRVKAAVNGASIVVYLGHGNGWPSPYTYDPEYTTKDGFGLNYDVNGDGKLSDYELKYYGEPSIRTLTPARNAIVLLFHLCYASGNSEPGQADPTLTTAKQRVDHYGSAFLAAGARAVLANGHSHANYYIDALFTSRQTMDQYFRNAPDAHGNVHTYTSVRSPGYQFEMDPESTGRYYRSITGNMALTTAQVTGGGYTSTAGDPSTFAVPGNATTGLDGARVFATADAIVLGEEPVDVLPLDTRVRVVAKDARTAPDGSAILHVTTDGGIDGWMLGSSLIPRDSTPPKAWDVADGAALLSPNGDGTLDTWTLTVDLSETAAWTIRIRNGGGSTVASADGDGDTATITWAPAEGSVADGTYHWQLEAVDDWGNGPLTVDGSVRVDTQAPTLALADADAAAVPVFAPNGDGYHDTFALAGTSSEPGTLVATALNAGGASVDTFSAKLASGAATLSWDGKNTSGYVPDGRYTIRVRAKDAAGNLSAPQTRTVDVFAALGYVASSHTVFFPQDADTLARTTTFSMKLRTPATVTWRVIDADGNVVRTFATDAAYAAGAWTKSWNGRDDAGAFVPRGTYRSEVRVTDGTSTAVQRATVVADAFRFVVSDVTPARGQRITVTLVTPEALSANPRIAVYQPGISTWAVGTTKVSSTTYRATFTLRSSRTGTLALKAYGTDTNGHSQRSFRYLPLH